MYLSSILEPDWRLMTLYRDNGASNLTLRPQRETGSIVFKPNSISNVPLNMTVQSVCATHLTHLKSAGCCKVKWIIRAGEGFKWRRWPASPLTLFSEPEVATLYTAIKNLRLKCFTVFWNGDQISWHAVRNMHYGIATKSHKCLTTHLQ